MRSSPTASAGDRNWRNRRHAAPATIPTTFAARAQYTARAKTSRAPVSLSIKYTYEGDANIDGPVDITDLAILATNWQLSPRDWFQGDFNYDGTVNITDNSMLATNWQAGVGSPLAPGGGEEDDLIAAMEKLGLPTDWLKGEK